MIYVVIVIFLLATGRTVSSAHGSLRLEQFYTSEAYNNARCLQTDRSQSQLLLAISASSEMTYILSGGALNSTRSILSILHNRTYRIHSSRTRGEDSQPLLQNLKKR